MVKESSLEQLAKEAVTPKQFMIPEWVPQSAVLVTWPHEHTAFRDMLDVIQTSYTELVTAMAEFEPVIIISYDEALKKEIILRLTRQKADLTRIHFVIAPTQDIWIRDYGPISMYNNQCGFWLNFTFNGWGNKYPADLDNEVTSHICNAGYFDRNALETSKMILEGGSLESDGRGTLLTTRKCLLAPNRNPQWDQKEIEAQLKKYFGAHHFLWLKNGYLAGDDTDSHIDMLARFINIRSIAYICCDDRNDEHYEELNAMEMEIKRFVDPFGYPYRLTPLPFTRPIYNDEGKRLPASYANFLIMNNAVIAPIYNDPADERALYQLGMCFPSRKIIPINALPWIHQYGSLHCATMQIPNSRFVTIPEVATHD